VNNLEVIISLVVDSKLPCSSAARALHMTPAEFAKLLNSHGIVVLKPTPDETQRELEAAAAFAARMTAGEK
jgi:hypothetical protein